MRTQVLPVTEESIALAARLLNQGELVALPTETVYGIAADARNGAAVRKIFEAKGRPQDNPLIVHIYGMEMLHGIVTQVPVRARKLAEAFWPGPLTMVMPRGPEVSDVTCAGLDTVGVRMPSHPVVQAVIQASGVAFAAPSANLSGKPSPTNAQDTLADMDGRLPLILDGGESNVGVESTVLSVVGEHPMLLRPGYITKEQMEAVLGEEVLVSPAILEKLKEGEIARSPGMKYKHYAPHCRTVLFAPDELERAVSYFSDREKNGERVLALCEHAVLQNFPKGKALDLGKNGEEFAAKLYVLLHEAEERCDELIAVEPAERGGVMAGVLNRLRKACGAKQ